MKQHQQYLQQHNKENSFYSSNVSSNTITTCTSTRSTQKPSFYFSDSRRHLFNAVTSPQSTTSNSNPTAQKTFTFTSPPPHNQPQSVQSTLNSDLIHCYKSEPRSNSHNESSAILQNLNANYSFNNDSSFVSHQPPPIKLCSDLDRHHRIQKQQKQQQQQQPSLHSYSSTPTNASNRETSNNYHRIPSPRTFGQLNPNTTNQYLQMKPLSNNNGRLSQTFNESTVCYNNSHEDTRDPRDRDNRPHFDDESLAALAIPVIQATTKSTSQSVPPMILDDLIYSPEKSCNIDDTPNDESVVVMRKDDFNRFMEEQKIMQQLLLAHQQKIATIESRISSNNQSLEQSTHQQPLSYQYSSVRIRNQPVLSNPLHRKPPAPPVLRATPTSSSSTLTSRRNNNTNSFSYYPEESKIMEETEEGCQNIVGAVKEVIPNNQRSKSITGTTTVESAQQSYIRQRLDDFNGLSFTEPADNYDSNPYPIRIKTEGTDDNHRQQVLILGNRKNSNTIIQPALLPQYTGLRNLPPNMQLNSEKPSIQRSSSMSEVNRHQRQYQSNPHPESIQQQQHRVSLTRIARLNQSRTDSQVRSSLNQLPSKNVPAAATVHQSLDQQNCTIF